MFKKFKVELVRHFYTSDVVYIDAKDEGEAYEMAIENFDDITKPIPPYIFHYLSFQEEESDIDIFIEESKEDV